jgi:hypothetical protein
MFHIVNDCYLDLIGSPKKENCKVVQLLTFEDSLFFKSIEDIKEKVCFHLSGNDLCFAIVCFLKEVYPSIPKEEIKNIYDLTIERFCIQLSLVNGQDYSSLKNKNFNTLYEQAIVHKSVNKNLIGVEYLVGNFFAHTGFYGAENYPNRDVLVSRLKKFFDDSKTKTVDEIKKELIYKIDRIDKSIIPLLAKDKLSDFEIKTLSNTFASFYKKYAEGYSSKYQELSTLNDFLLSVEEAEIEDEGYLKFLLKDVKRPHSILFCTHTYINKVNLFLINYFYDSFLNKGIANRHYFL